MTTEQEPAGLTRAEVAERVARGEVNRAPPRGWAEYRDIVARNVLTFFNALVVPAGIALFLLGDYRSAWTVSAMALINSLIGLAQETRAKRHLNRLAILAEPRARVRRDGAEVAITAGDIVRGDLVLLMSGEAVVADGTVVRAKFLEIDEALLTGESDPIPRIPGDRLLSGSICIAGEGCYTAESVGGEGFAQRLATEAREYRYSPSPMQRVLDTLIRILTGITVSLCVLYVALYLLRGFPAETLWQMIAATVTSMVPQGLVLMATIALTLGAVRLSARGAVVQRLSAVEVMASIDVLCMDKTGTLTTNRLKLDHIVPIAGNVDEVRDSLRSFACASIDAGSKTIAAIRTALGDLPPTETPDVTDQLPFKSQNRFSAVRLRYGNRESALVLGAFEALAPLLADQVTPEAAWRDLLSSGLRLLLFAEADGQRSFDGSLDGFALRPLALVALSDELRPEAGPVLAELSRHGMMFKVISGDNPETVKATINQLPLGLAEKQIVNGGELDATADRDKLIREATVFGRVAPHQKLEIVTELQRQGHSVGMIGDGVNDVLTIKRADLGIAMGAGSGAARTVAGLVLETNDFALLPQALNEGRAILHNLRRAAKLFLLKNVYTLILIVAGVGVFGLGFPYLPQQVTLLNTLTIGGPAFLIVFGRQSPGRPARRGFVREVGLFALVAGLGTGAMAIAGWLDGIKWFGDDEATQRTRLLAFLVLTGLANVLVITGGDRRLVIWSTAALSAFVACVYVAPLADFFVLTPLTMRHWLTAGAASVPVLLLVACYTIVEVVLE